MPLASVMPSDRPLDFREVYDISVPLGMAPSWPGDRPFSLQWPSGEGSCRSNRSEPDDGSGCLLSAISLCTHAATHLDFPGHLYKDGKRQDGFCLNSFIMQARVVSARAETKAVTPAALKDGLPGGRVQAGEAILFKTANSKRRLLFQPSFCRDYVSISPDTAHLCADGKAALVGIDYLSVDDCDSEALPVHRILLKKDILILEGIDLSAVPCGKYTLLCLPLSLGRAEASPVRAALLR